MQLAKILDDIKAWFGFDENFNTVMARYRAFETLVPTANLTFDEWSEATHFRIGEIDADVLNLDIFPNMVEEIHIDNAKCEEIIIPRLFTQLHTLSIKRGEYSEVLGLGQLPSILNLELANARLLRLDFSALPRVMNVISVPNNQIESATGFKSGLHLGVLCLSANPLRVLDINMAYLVTAIDLRDTQFAPVVPDTSLWTITNTDGKMSDKL